MYSLILGRFAVKCAAPPPWVELKSNRDQIGIKSGTLTVRKLLKKWWPGTALFSITHPSGSQLPAFSESSNGANGLKLKRWREVKSNHNHRFSKFLNPRCPRASNRFTTRAAT